jgi:hypothetical protein
MKEGMTPENFSQKFYQKRGYESRVFRGIPPPKKPSGPGRI